MLARCVIQLLYGIIGILAYLLVFYAMFGVRKILSRNFIVIYTLMGVTNIATWANAWIYLKLRVEPSFIFYYEWLQGQPLIVTIHSFLVNHFYFAQNIDLFLLTFDRFTTMISSVKNTKWWNKYYLVIAIALHGIVLAVHMIFRLPLSASMHVCNGSFEITLSDSRNPIFATMQLVCGISVIITCLILNIVTLIFLRKLRNTRHASTENSFIVITICIFLTQLMNLSIACILVISLSFDKRFSVYSPLLHEIMLYTSDLLCLGPALYTVLLPGPIRRFLIGKAKDYLYTHTSDNGSSPSS